MKNVKKKADAPSTEAKRFLQRPVHRGPKVVCESAPHIEPGDAVRHSRFGEGIILDLRPLRGGGTCAVTLFGGQERNMAYPEAFQWGYMTLLDSTDEGRIRRLADVKKHAGFAAPAEQQAKRRGRPPKQREEIFVPVEKKKRGRKPDPDKERPVTMLDRIETWCREKSISDYDSFISAVSDEGGEMYQWAVLERRGIAQKTKGLQMMFSRMTEK